MASNTQFSDQTDSDVQVEFDVPPQYKVLFFNDDYTTMEFVVEVLMDDFNKTFEEASALWSLFSLMELHTHREESIPKEM